ncbi:MAG: hypothetical protein QGF49_06885 [Candidatus Marinimicrobia bacterium]|jgi:hypothetical protein|nr:hypothetical protein [Candidatus Neomarinimicrobiota bacterium]MDP7127678.1 hypothetical protein [Candidatus Neomarinimicrobiota bacterium]MDP7564562.1 hypothetical protein [Candidatus Neomarinimicrobiota bacterium]|tara:strand:- start:54 stop:1049 length:996 start_codon:yes stop_codon:yes gene_type:complete
MKNLILLSIIASFFGCIEPNSEDIWTLNKIAQVDTEGYCRDVFISGDSVFVAAGQAGIQLWDISTITAPTLVWKKSLSELGVSKEISQVEYEPAIKQLFALESNERPIHLDMSKGDTVSVVGQFSSEKTKEFRVVTNSETSFTCYAADNDDGLKTSTFEFDSSFGLWFNTSGEEIASVGNPNGIDLLGDEIVLTLDQLGIEAFHNENGLITSSYHIDLEGNARAVSMISGGELFVACEEAGAFKLATGFSSQWDYKVQFAKELFVTHVASNNSQIAVSCASNGLALYEEKQSNSIEERGIHDIGYVYHSEFSNGYLFAASREGLQIFEIDE